MKKSLWMGCLLLAGATACEKEYDASDFDAAPVVVTDYDPETDFSALHTYFLADSILLIGQSEKAALPPSPHQREPRCFAWYAA